MSPMAGGPVKCREGEDRESRGRGLSIAVFLGMSGRGWARGLPLKTQRARFEMGRGRSCDHVA